MRDLGEEVGGLAEEGEPVGAGEEERGEGSSDGDDEQAEGKGEGETAGAVFGRCGAAELARGAEGEGDCAAECDERNDEAGRIAEGDTAGEPGEAGEGEVEEHGGDAQARQVADERAGVLEFGHRG